MISQPIPGVCEHEWRNGVCVNCGTIRGRPSVRCPSCGIQTIPNREGLTYEEMLCDGCALLHALDERSEP